MGGKKIKRNFVVAHQVEARPIIEFYRLTKDITHRAFNVYENDHVKLIVSGEGKVLCAAATAYCYSLQSCPEVPAMWTNVGIVGHAVHQVGSLWRINKVTDLTTSNIIFPMNILRSSSIYGESLISVDVPETGYSGNSLYDMEASAFFLTASRFASLEYINSFKVVSDNKNQPLGKFSLNMAAQLIEKRIEVIDDYLQELENILKNNFNNIMQAIDIKNKLFHKYKFTHTQQLKCDELLKSLAVHGIHCTEELFQYSNSKQVLDSLNHRLKKIELVV